MPAAQKPGKPLGLTEQGLLYHGADFHDWLVRVCVMVNRSNKLPKEEKHINMNHLLLMTSPTRYLRAVKAMISKPLLDRIPEVHKRNAPSLVCALPTYNKTFRLMDLPPEIRLMIYKATGLPSKVVIDNEHIFLSPACHLTHVSTVIRRELLPDLYGKMLVHVYGSVRFDHRILPQDSLQYMTRFALYRHVFDGNNRLELKVKPGAALSYRVLELCRQQVRQEYCYREVEFGDIDPHRHFRDQLDQAVRKLNLDVAKACYRGKDLMFLVLEMENIITRYNNMLRQDHQNTHDDSVSNDSQLDGDEFYDEELSDEELSVEELSDDEFNDGQSEDALSD